MTDTKKKYDQDFTDMLFEDRNRWYGAYDLRKRYNKRLLIGLFFALACLLTTVLLPLAIEAMAAFRTGMAGGGEESVEVFMEPPGGMPPIELPEPPAEEKVKAEVKKEIVPEVVAKLDSTQTKKEDKSAKAPDTKLASNGKSGQESETPGDGGLQGGGSQGEGMGGNGFTIEAASNVVNYEDVMMKEMQYPEKQKIRQVEDEVWVTLKVNEYGTPSDCQVYSSIKKLPEFEAEAVRLACMMKYKPAIRHGQPVKSILRIPIRFKLKRIRT